MEICFLRSICTAFTWLPTTFKCVKHKPTKARVVLPRELTADANKQMHTEIDRNLTSGNRKKSENIEIECISLSARISVVRPFGTHIRECIQRKSIWLMDITFSRRCSVWVWHRKQNLVAHPQNIRVSTSNNHINASLHHSNSRIPIHCF